MKINFEPVTSISEKYWLNLDNYLVLADVISTPLMASEVLQCAHYYPLAICESEATVSLHAILDETYLKSPIIGSDGSWKRPYIPASIRGLPFRKRFNTDGRYILEVATNLGILSNEKGYPIHRWGRPGQELVKLERLLDEAVKKSPLLQNAARDLLIADLLVPLHLSEEGSEKATPQERFWIADASKISELNALRSSLIAQRGILWIDLLFALLFSESHLRPRRLGSEVVQIGGNAVHPMITDLDAIVKNITPLDFEFDRSELACFDQFTMDGDAQRQG